MHPDTPQLPQQSRQPLQRCAVLARSLAAVASREVLRGPLGPTQPPRAGRRSKLPGQRARPTPMPLTSEGGDRWPALLAERAGTGADVTQVADTVAVLWHEIDEALHPVIGHRGVAALYARSLDLTLVAHPWLAQDHPGAQAAAIDPAALKAALATQPAAEALAGGSALFQSFHALLASLVGVALTDRLLRSVWVHSSGTTSGTAPAQDISP